MGVTSETTGVRLTLESARELFNLLGVELGELPRPGDRRRPPRGGARG